MKALCRLECDTVRIFKLKKGPRQMVSANSRLYRIDDELMVKDVRTGDCYAFYDIDSTQPYSSQPILVDPDFTRALIDSAKLAGNKKSIWMNVSGSKLMEYLTVAVVVGALIYGFLVGGGF